jgi:hypothetical protein
VVVGINHCLLMQRGMQLLPSLRDQEEVVMSFFALGIEKATIYSNREVFSPAEVRFHSFVADQQLSLPEAERLVSATDVEERREIVRNMVPAVAAKWETIPIGGIPDRHTFVFGDTGRIVYRAAEIPLAIDWLMFVIEDDSDIRQFGSQIDEFFTDDRLDNVASSIIALSGAAMTPPVAAGIALGKMMVRGFTFFAKGNQDDQLGVIEQSFIRPLHFPQGTRHGVGIQDLSSNMWYDYFIYGTDEM